MKVETNAVKSIPAPQAPSWIPGFLFSSVQVQQPARQEQQSLYWLSGKAALSSERSSRSMNL